MSDIDRQTPSLLELTSAEAHIPVADGPLQFPAAPDMLSRIKNLGPNLRQRKSRALRYGRDEDVPEIDREYELQKKLYKRLKATGSNTDDMLEEEAGQLLERAAESFKKRSRAMAAAGTSTRISTNRRRVLQKVPKGLKSQTQKAVSDTGVCVILTTTVSQTLEAGSSSDSQASSNEWSREADQLAISAAQFLAGVRQRAIAALVDGCIVQAHSGIIDRSR